MLFKLSKQIRKILCELYGFFWTCTFGGEEKKRAAHNSTHSRSKIFISPFFQSKKIIILFEKIYIVLIADKGNR